MKLLKTLLVLSLFVLASGCSTGAVVEKDNDGLNIVTTISPLYSLTANLVEGTNVNLTNLIPPNSSVHTFQLSPSDLRVLTSADIVIINGLELEEFLEDSLEELGATIVDTSVGVELLSFDVAKEDDDHDEDHEDEHEEDHGHGEFDPHIWLSPKNAAIQSGNIVSALLEKDPENAGMYGYNLKQVDERLKEIDDELRAKFKALEVKPYIVFHDAYQYFENNFGIGATAYIEEFPGKEPSVAYLAEVANLIEKNGIKVIFAEPQFSPKLVKSLSQDYDLVVGSLDPIGKELSKDAYFDLLRANYAEFERVFSKK